ncbi:MAG TPA: hypothetical protein VKZ18_05950 [Polyangia bacterium]|nr:hypothetical protein [Polyangia bacterium]
MRSFLSLLLLSSALALGAGCGPKEAFCPNVGADAGGVCPIFGDDAQAPIQDTGTNNPCPGGGFVENPDGNGLICVCSNGGPPPCQ